MTWRIGRCGSAIRCKRSSADQSHRWADHGGIFVLPIPNAVTNLPLYIVAILAGTLVTTDALFVLKRPIAVEEDVEEGQVMSAVA